MQPELEKAERSLLVGAAGSIDTSELQGTEMKVMIGTTGAWFWDSDLTRLQFNAMQMPSAGMTRPLHTVHGIFVTVDIGILTTHQTPSFPRIARSCLMRTRNLWLDFTLLLLRTARQIRVP